MPNKRQDLVRQIERLTISDQEAYYELLDSGLTKAANALLESALANGTPIVKTSKLKDVNT